jgi:hypothetical protein
MRAVYLAQLLEYLPDLAESSALNPQARFIG